jgi:Tfp pilus assembly protein PilV
MSMLEVLISLVILMVVSLALMRTSIVGVQANVQNSLREEAARIADKTVGDLRARSYAVTYTDPVLSTPTTTATVERKFRSFKINYSVTTNIGDISASNKQVSVEVKWNYKGSGYSHITTAILGRK